MKPAGGFTIVQIMLALLVVGIVLWAAVNAVIDKRCENDSAGTLCAKRATARAK